MVTLADRRSANRVGLLMGVGSAATFGLSGPFAKSLLVAGWSPAAVVVARLGVASLALLVPVLLLQRVELRGALAHRRYLLSYGVVAIGGVQVCYFNAVRYLPVGVALMIEYLAPVLVVGWHWMRTRRAPSRATFAGAAVAMVGLVFVLDLTGAGGTLNPIGLGWALTAALGLCGYFLLSERSQVTVPPLLLAGVGTAIGAVFVLAVGVVGLLPLRFTSAPARLGGHRMPWIVPVLVLALVCTVAAYLTGVGAIARLGAKVGSFLALAEVLFAVLISWPLLGELPHPAQLLGGALILAGIVTIQRNPDAVPAVPAVEPVVLSQPGS